ncbi:ATP-dependent helicase HrpB [Algibacillus agarilyticus]|uniref:ATP-dependent helicase HrpB n=1 Tax=Algibacillus agarilyticus TaxID=2234133 RepID=UPI0022B81C8A|nr:ATP-dependent helicase HrpB [Algibacillus agarilyticus]
MLPIESCFPEITDVLQKSNQLILQAPPGAGKSTWLPLALYKAQIISQKILLLEPRRVAARNIAHYLASCLNENLGETVGIRMRGYTKVSPQTKIEVITEGVLTRMLQTDPELTGYGLILFDEFHERALQADTAFAFSYDVQQALRDDLKLVIMSATLDLDMTRRILPDAPVIESAGRQFPVACHYRPLSRQYLSNHVAQVVLEALEYEGDILVFLPGIAEINQCERVLLPLIAENACCIKLHGKLSLEAQQAALKPIPGKQKIVLSTNIAETSLTISGVKVVIDSGMHKRVKVDHKSGFSTLFSERISSASAGQRLGRAGRVAPGTCFRLWSEDENARLRQQYPPEIETSDVTQTYFELLNWGAQTFAELNWPSLPSVFQQQQALDKLIAWQLVTAEKSSTRLTPLGRQVAALKIPLAIALLLVRQNESCALLAAWQFEQQPNPQQQLDLMSQLIDAHRLQPIKSTLKKWGYATNRLVLNETLIKQALLAIFSDRLAQKRKNAYVLASGKAVVFASDVMFEKLTDYIIVVDAHFSESSASGRITSYVALTEADLAELVIPKCTTSIDIELTEVAGKAVFYKTLKFAELTISKTRLAQKPTKVQLQQAWLGVIQHKGFTHFEGKDKLLQLLLRLQLAHELQPELFNELIDLTCLQLNAEQWFALYLTDIASLQALYKINLVELVYSGLDYPQQTWLNKNLPTTWCAPDGTKCKLEYRNDREVTAFVKMQSCYGLNTHPTVGNGHLLLTLSLLSPAQRALQTTKDIVSFWQGSYVDVKKEMKGRYPKHFWPDSPESATPGTQTKRQRLN